MTRFPQCISPRISLPVSNLGEIPGKTATRFLPPWICFSARNLARFAVGFRRDFGCWDYCFPARILVSFAAESRQNFGRRDFSSRWESWWDSRQDPGEILAARIFASRRESWRTIPARFWLPGSRRDSHREEKSLRPKSHRDPGGIPAKILAGSRQDPGPYFTMEEIRIKSILN